ncbi:MAG: peptidylprolyl isomerase [Candidatus Krumholzibacteriia bacterium]
MKPPALHPRSARHLVGAVLALGGLLLMLGGCRDRGDTAAATPPPADGPSVALSHILVAFDGVVDQPSGLSRTREEALERARRIAVLLRTGRGDLAEMARRYSDDPTAQRNAGYLGIFHLGDMEPHLEAAVTALAVGEIGGPVETSHGFHIVRREPVRRVNVHHLLVAYRDAVLADSHVTRDRDEARRVAYALRRKLAEGKGDLCDLAAQFSDDGQNSEQCGELGWVEPGMLSPAAEQAVFNLQPGEVSPVVESEYGFHIFWRD